jgi:hypothetical protein
VTNPPKTVATCSFVAVSSNTANLTLTNVYPSYFNHFDMEIQDCGTVTAGGNVTVTSGSGSYVTLDLTGGGKPDIEVFWPNNYPRQIDPGPLYNLDQSFDIHILENMPQNTTVTFTIVFNFQNWQPS